MNIAGLNKADVLAALYNAASPQGMGFLQANVGHRMTRDEAQALLDKGLTYFDYLHGRVMKVKLEGDEVRTTLFNRDNGVDAAERAVDALREKGLEVDPAIEEARVSTTIEKAAAAKEWMGTKATTATATEDLGGVEVRVVRLGAPHEPELRVPLKAALDRVLGDKGSD